MDEFGGTGRVRESLSEQGRVHVPECDGLLERKETSRASKQRQHEITGLQDLDDGSVLTQNIREEKQNAMTTTCEQAHAHTRTGFDQH